MEDKITQAAEWIKNSKHMIAFTGAGISVESGIPPFRGEGGLWNKHDPALFEISYFKAHPAKSWELIKDIFFETFGKVEPHGAHHGLAQLEEKGILKAIVTQNIDGLHQRAGSRNVLEFHGTCRTLSCLLCRFPYETGKVAMDILPPRCPKCMGILRPDFVFFGEAIPRDVSMESFHQAQLCDVCIVIGSTGEVMPACQVPFNAKEKGARIIEINLEPSNFTPTIADIYLQGKAGGIMPLIMKRIEGE
ncbi:MAG: NAD-dependent deacylase [bacterium]|nr:NAD-dependent deacylase [bacterium]